MIAASQNQSQSQNQNQKPEPEPEPEPEPVAGNLLINGDFAQGKTGWFDCGAASNVTADAGGLRITNGGCLYQEVPATVGERYELACDASRVGDSWTVMELSFLDANYTSLNSSVSQVVTGIQVTEYQESSVAPANTIYGLAVLYSEDDTVFDNCVLRLSDTTDPEPNPEPEPEPEPEPNPNPNPGDGINLLSNGGFENNLSNWSSCAATTLVSISDDTFEGAQSVNVNNGGCLYQEFNVEPGTSYKLDCQAKRNGLQYTSITLAMLDNQYASLATEEVPVNTAVYSSYSATVVATQASLIGTVVVYSEDPGYFDNCEVIAN